MIYLGSREFHMKEQTVFEIIHNMDKVTNQLIVGWNKMFQEELGVSHILVLGHLAEQGKSRPSDIAKQLGLTPPTLTHLSEKLVQKQLATRLADEHDRRIIYLAITDAGKEAFERANEKGKVLRQQLFDRLTVEETKQLLEIYQKLNEPNE